MVVSTNTNNTTSTNGTHLANETEPTDAPSGPPGDRISWDGKVVKAGAWHEEKLFTVGDLTVTKGGATGLGAGTIVAIIIGVLICMFCSWRKREVIAEGVRRASTIVYNAGVQIRRSIIGG